MENSYSRRVSKCFQRAVSNVPLICEGLLSALQIYKQEDGHCDGESRCDDTTYPSMMYCIFLRNYAFPPVIRFIPLAYDEMSGSHLGAVVGRWPSIK